MTTISYNAIMVLEIRKEGKEMKTQLLESMIKLTKELSENNIIYEEKGYFSVFNKTSMKRVGNIVKCGDKWVYKTI